MSTRIVFMGTPDFAVPSLRSLHASEFEICAVMTGPPKPAGRGRRVQITPMQDTAESLGIRVLIADDLQDPALHATYRALKPDLSVVVAFRILPRIMLDIPALGTINLHASLLPQYRGAAPIQRALMAGESRTGVTSFLIEPRVDTGNILDVWAIDIGPDETCGELSGRLSALGAEMLVDSVRRHALGASAPRPQDDTTATRAPKITSADCPIRWAEPARTIHTQIRGLSPVPGATTHLGGAPVKILRTHVVNAAGSSTDPGRVIFAHPKNGLQIQCGQGILEILEIVRPGKTPVSGKEFVGGRQIQQSDRLT